MRSGLVQTSRTIQAADGTRIAYRVTGQGPPLVLANGLSTTDFFWRHVLPRWARSHRVVSWDYKGHGGSEPARTEGGATIPALADDMRRVMDAADVSRAVLVGFSMGCQVVLEAWRHYPERIAGLGCLLGPAGRLFDTALRPAIGPGIQGLFRHLPDPWLPRAFGLVDRLVRLPGVFPLGRALWVYRGSSRADIGRYIDHFGTIDPRSLGSIALSAGEHDARDLLPTIDVPTLVVAGDRDIFAPAQTVGLPIHAAIPGARLLRISDGTHCALFERPVLIGDAVEDLLRAAWGSATPQARLAASGAR